MYNDIGKNIKKIRKEKGLTQQDLAALCYTSQQVVQRWEAGSRTPQDIFVVAKALGVSPWDILASQELDIENHPDDWPYTIEIDNTKEENEYLKYLEENAPNSFEKTITEMYLAKHGGKAVIRVILTEAEYYIYLSESKYIPEYEINDFNREFTERITKQTPYKIHLSGV